MNESLHDEDTEFVCPPGTPIMDRLVVKNIFIFIYSVVFICCLFGNLLILCVICFQRHMRSNTNFLLANLALADLLVAVFCVLQNLFQLFIFPNGTWPLGESLCHVYIFVLHLVPCTSSGILVLVCVERYIAVLHPIAAKTIITVPKLVGVTLFAWVISILCNVPYLVSAKHFRWPNGDAACGRDYNGAINLKDLNTVAFVLWYCIPLITMCVLYSKISVVLWKSTAGHVPSESQRLKSPQGTDEENEEMVFTEDPRVSMRKRIAMKKSSGEQHMEDSRRKVVRMLLAVVLAFSFMTLPRYARLLWQAWMPPHQICLSSVTVLIQPSAFVLLFLNSGINPFLYAFLSQRFREALVTMVKCGTNEAAVSWQQRKLRSAKLGLVEA